MATPISRLVPQSGPADQKQHHGHDAQRGIRRPRRRRSRGYEGETGAVAMCRSSAAVVSTGRLLARSHPGNTFRKEAAATAPPAMDGREDQVVNTAQDILTVNPDRSGKPDYRLPTHPGWFRRCRYTGEVQWVPASAVSDRRPVHRRRGRIPDRPTSPACGRWSGRAGSQPERVQATVAR